LIWFLQKKYLYLSINQNFMAKRKKLEKGQFPDTKFKTKNDANGLRMMQCQNSIPNGKWWKGQICNEYCLVGDQATAVLCSRCVQKHVEPPVPRGSSVKSDKPRGWKFMKEFVAPDGTVYHKGIEQPSLKGTLPATKIEPKEPKKKMSKQEKEVEVAALGKEIAKLKAELFAETRKTKKAEITRALSKATRQLKKVM
jgi:hypothetical protein